MADWVRSPKTWWWTNHNWIQYAFEKARNNSIQWQNYYGSKNIKGFLSNSKGLNSSNPFYHPFRSTSSCSACDLVARCGDWSALCRDKQIRRCEADSNVEGDNGCAPCLCPANCDNAQGEYTQGNCLDLGDGLGGFPCEGCPTAPPEDCISICVACQCEADENPEDPFKGCIDRTGNWAVCTDDDSTCDPCGDCDSDDWQPCPCGGTTVPGGPVGCVFRTADEGCASGCCLPNEPGCVECCPGCESGCGNWAPEGSCDCDGDDCDFCPGGSCDPFGYPMSLSYCESCDYCNFYPQAPQCVSCCQCPNGIYVECGSDEDDICNPVDPDPCLEAGANCYGCNGTLIPIWFACEDEGACPNPYNPDCEQGDSIVCYDYNTNDPIYYNATNLGSTVIIEFDTIEAGGSYSYGRVATLCEIPDSLQLCVYGTNGSVKTKLTYLTDFTIDESAGTITLDSNLNVSSYTGLKLERCTDDGKMFLTFTEGAKLSATDVNASLHQLLFLIQEKEFASNSYYQIENAGQTKAGISFPITSTKIQAEVADAIDTAGLLTALSSQAVNDHTLSFNFPSTAGGQGVTKILLDEDQSTSPAATANTIGIGIIGAAASGAFFDFHDTNKPTNGQQATIISTDGTTKFYEASSGGNDTSGNGNTSSTPLKFTIAGSVADMISGLKAAIEHSNGHAGKIACALAAGSNGTANHKITMTQSIAGANGNTTVTENFSHVGSASFSAGGTSDADVAALIIKAINGGTNISGENRIVGATSGNGTGTVGIQGISAEAGTSTTKIKLKSIVAGSVGNTTGGVVEDVGSNDDLVAGTKDLALGADFTASEFHGFKFILIALNADASTTTKTYQFDSDGTPANGSEISSNVVAIQIQNLLSSSQLTNNIQTAINNGTNGHGTKLSVTRSTSTLLNDTVNVSQVVGGTAGNFTGLIHDSALNARMKGGDAVWNFTGGLANDDSNPLITFDPPTSLPVNFNFAGIRQNYVLVWDGETGFTGRSPSNFAANIALDNLSNVSFNTSSTGDVAYFNGSEWTNQNIQELVNSTTNVFDLKNWTSYDSASNGTLDDFYYTPCDAALDTAWSGSNSCMSTIPKSLVPNAFTSYGLGYYAAEKQIIDQVGNTASTLNTQIQAKVDAAGQAAGIVLTSFRWEIGRGEGRDLNAVGATSVNKYPRAFFDVRDFDYLNGTVDTTTTVTRGDYANYPAAPHGDGSLTSVVTTNANVAYYREGKTGATEITPYPRNKIWSQNITNFLYDGLKSRAAGFRRHPDTVTNPADADQVSNDRYLDLLKSVLNKADWSAAMGYTETHPLAAKPTATHNYPDFLDGQVVPAYSYETSTNTVTDSAGTVGQGGENYYYSTFNLPTVMTYYFKQFQDKSSSVPTYMEWQGNLHDIGDLDLLTGTDQKTYLGADGNYWFYYRWFTQANDTAGSTASTSDESTYDQALSFYSPFDPTKVALEADDTEDMTVYPATGQSVSNEDEKMARAGGYSFLVHANTVFTDIAQWLPDIHDEYVFRVSFSNEGKVLGGANCTDARCYEVVAKIEKFTDGCSDGESNCSKVGAYNTAGNTINGYFVYPQDFRSEIVKVWDNYDYSKLDVEIRNKTGDGFDLVLKVPRMKRVGKLQVFKGKEDSSGASEDEYRTMALDWLSDYSAGDWDATADYPDGTSDSNNSIPLLREMSLDNPAAFDIETAVQFIRTGIPANVRVSFFTLSTPQTNMLADG